jgi:hypothetical protein
MFIFVGYRAAPSGTYTLFMLSSQYFSCAEFRSRVARGWFRKL